MKGVARRGRAVGGGAMQNPRWWNELGGGPKDIFLTTSGFTNLPGNEGETRGTNKGAVQRGQQRGLCHQLGGGRTEGRYKGDNKGVCATKGDEQRGLYKGDNKGVCGTKGDEQSFFRVFTFFYVF